MGNNSTRRTFPIAVVALVCLAAAAVNSPIVSGEDDYGVKFTDVARAAGITHKTIYGDERKNKYLLETTGCGVAWFDYDNDGWLDLFFVNGTRLGGFPKGEEPTSRLYRNNRDGTFTDVTKQSGLARAGWGQAVCAGDYDNDGFEDLFISYYGRNALYKNDGKGAFIDVSEKAGVTGRSNGPVRWGSGAAFIDYDRDGDLDLFVANYIDLDLKTAPTPETGPCLYKGVMVACGPPGLEGGRNILYRNDGAGTFTDVSDKAGILKTYGTYGLGVAVADFDNDSWPDIYVANDSAPAALYHNNKDGTFTDIGVEAGAAYSGDGKPQAGMGVGVGDYDGDGLLDIFKTNFSGDTSTLYRNLGLKSGLLSFDDVTFTAGIGVNTRFLGWGCGFVDFDNDGWLDIFLVNGHVYPEVEKLTTEAGYPQRKVLYQNQRNGSFKDISEKVGGPLVEPTASRGCAFGDFDNDGDINVAINPVNDFPVLLRADSATNNNWISIKLIGVKSNRDGVGARIKVIAGDRAQIDEVRSGGSYYSQNDMRVHFGLGKAVKARSIEVRWPSGTVDALSDVAAGQVVFIKEGAGRIIPRLKARPVNKRANSGLAPGVDEIKLPSEEIMFCPSCGFEYALKTNYCKRCGESLNPTGAADALKVQRGGLASMFIAIVAFGAVGLFMAFAMLNKLAGRGLRGDDLMIPFALALMFTGAISGLLIWQLARLITAYQKTGRNVVVERHYIREPAPAQLGEPAGEIRQTAEPASVVEHTTRQLAGS